MRHFQLTNQYKMPCNGQTYILPPGK